MPLQKPSGVLKAWRWSVWLAPLWWAAGLNLFIYHILSIAFVFIVISQFGRETRAVRLPGSIFFLLILTVTYLFSILIHLGSSDAPRVLAGFYNLTFWGMGAGLVLVFSNLFSVDRIPEFINTFPVFALVSGLTASLCFAMQFLGYQSLIFETPLYELGSLLGRTVLVENSLLVKLLYPDWFVSLWRPRFNLYSPYPTAAGGIYLILLIMVIMWARAENKRSSSVVWLLIFSNFLGLFMTLSRMSMLALAASVTVVFLLQARRSVIWIALALLVLTVLLPWLDRWSTFLWGLREGSSIQRLELYRYSLLQMEGTDWILGLGMKPREGAFRYPLGSHSTYLSVLFKTGIFGLIMFLAFQLNLGLRWYQLKKFLRRYSKEFFLWQGFGMVFFGMAIWMITDDIDAPQLLAYLYFSIIGIFEGFRREVLLCSPPILPQPESKILSNS